MPPAPVEAIFKQKWFKYFLAALFTCFPTSVLLLAITDLFTKWNAVLEFDIASFIWYLTPN